MSQPSKTRTLPPPSSTQRRPVTTGQTDWVKVEPLLPDCPYPTLITPRIDDLNLAEWGAENREFVADLFSRKRSLLFRGFRMNGADGPGSFGAFADAVSDGSRLPYLDRTTPRKTYGDKLYCTNRLPARPTHAPAQRGQLLGRLVAEGVHALA